MSIRQLRSFQNYKNIMEQNRITSDRITSLKDNEIFVFGSNKEGMHGGGAARIAYEDFGAEWGVGIGMTGQCYAIPTMDRSIDIIRRHVDDFTAYAKSHPALTFLVTPIGCGIDCASFRCGSGTGQCHSS